jgi:hypothetical protein
VVAAWRRQKKQALAQAPVLGRPPRLVLSPGLAPHTLGRFEEHVELRGPHGVAGTQGVDVRQRDIVQQSRPRCSSRALTPTPAVSPQRRRAPRRCRSPCQVLRSPSLRGNRTVANALHLGQLLVQHPRAELLFEGRAIVIGEFTVEADMEWGERWFRFPVALRPHAHVATAAFGRRERARSGRTRHERHQRRQDEWTLQANLAKAERQFDRKRARVRNEPIGRL